MSEPAKEKTDVLLKLFEDAKRFSEDLMRENERLRLKIVGQQAKGQVNFSLSKEGYQNELETLKESIVQLQEENKEFAEKFVEVEQQNQNMASLYVSSYRLHSTLDFREVIDIIKEIVINLIGSEKFGIFLKDDEKKEFGLVAHEGLEDIKVPPVQFGIGEAGKAAESGEMFVDKDEGNSDGKTPIACIPMAVQGETVGIIVIYQLLQQKDGFAPMDLELFALLADHAATAVYCSQLHNQSERKLNTMQNLLDLLKMEK